VRKLVTLVLVAAAAVAITAVALAATPRHVRASILAAARSEHSLHWTEHEVLGKALIESSADVNLSSGTQVVETKLGQQSGRVGIVLVSRTAYVEGDAFGLQANLGLTQAQATKYAGRWISIPKGDAVYAQTASGLTLGSIVRGMTPSGKLTLYRKTVRGTRIVVVEATSGTGTKESLESLAAHARGKPLPIEAAAIIPSRQALTHIYFSKWNEPVTVHPPPHSTPIARVRGG
jgi:hypothetical protein